MDGIEGIVEGIEGMESGIDGIAADAAASAEENDAHAALFLFSDDASDSASTNVSDVCEVIVFVAS